MSRLVIASFRVTRLALAYACQRLSRAATLDGRRSCARLRKPSAALSHCRARNIWRRCS